MNITNAKKWLSNELLTIFEEGEAYSIGRIIDEDYLNVDRIPSLNIISNDKFRGLVKIVNRLKRAEPIQYILGEADFFGLKFNVDYNVLIPRAETEELVDLAIQKIVENKYLNVLDIGTGSGCIPISIASRHPSCNCVGYDISSEALKIAESNATKNQVCVAFEQVDILDKSKWQYLPSFDLILSNPPYIPYSEMDQMGESVIKYEPNLALFVENKDPLIFYRNILDFAKAKLNINGLLIFEINPSQKSNLVENLLDREKVDYEFVLDIYGKDRMLLIKF